MTGIKEIGERLRKITAQIDPVLLLFLLLVLNFRLSFKILAIAGVYAYRPNFKFKRDGIFYFYVLMILLGLIHYLFLGKDFSAPHTYVVMTGTLFWVGCLLTYHQLKLSVESGSIEKLTRTMQVLAVINFIVSAFDLLKVMFLTHAINPYTQVSPPPYGISSGDLIGGVFGGMHLVNTIISSLLLVFFVYRQSLIYVLICLVPFLLTGSNLGTFILGGSLIAVAFLNRSIHFKNIALFSIAFIALFYIKITPDNQRYMVSVLKKATGQLTGAAKKQAVKKIEKVKIDSLQISAPKAIETKKQYTDEELILQYIAYKKKKMHLDTIKSEILVDTGVVNKLRAAQSRRQAMVNRLNDYVFFRKDSVAKSKSKMALFEYGKLKTFDLDKEAGKITSFKQTGAYLGQDTKSLLFGAGVGSFSSRLAFISSGIVEDSRILMAIPKYETEAFKGNHKAIFKYLMYRDDETHSITNLPFCWYNQVLGEYGLIGMLVFIVFYCFYWLKQMRYLSYGKYIFVAMLGFFFFDYWFERISVMVIFELLMMMDLKTNKLAKS